MQFAEWGGQLGIVRDIEVRAEVALAAMDDLGIDDAELRARLVDDEYEDYARAHARLRELHDGPRSEARMAALRAFADDPPVTSAAEPEAAALTKVARAEVRRVKRAAKRSDGSIESLHEVRKAGRRLRYVAEALHEADPGVFSDDVEELAAAGEDVHDALGDHRDELIFIDHLEIARAQRGPRRRTRRTLRRPDRASAGACEGQSGWARRRARSGQDGCIRPLTATPVDGER